MDRVKLGKHVKLCVKNLKSGMVKCCGECPFEEEILSVYPELEELFVRKKKGMVENHKLNYGGSK